MSELFDSCVDVAAAALASKGNKKLDPKSLVQNIFAYAATDAKFKEVIDTDNNRVKAALRSQIKFIAELGLDSSKGRKLVYVLTRGLNVAPHGATKKQWLTMPDIQISYHALIHVLVRGKSLKSVIALHTYQNYPIEYSGAIGDVPVVKSWEVSPEGRGAYTGLFVVLTLADGTVQTSYHHRADIAATHKAFTKSDATWKAHEQAMFAKSAILDSIRYIPVFDDDVATVIEHYDDEMDYSAGRSFINEEQANEIHAYITENEMEVKVMDYLKKKGVNSLAEIPADAFDKIMRVISK